MVSDDIVTRLHNECQCTDDCRAVNDPCIPMQAADEIERLRSDVARLGSFLHPTGTIAQFQARTGLTRWQVAQLFGVTRKEVGAWAAGGDIPPAARTRLGELCGIVDQSGHTDPMAVRDWLFTAAEGSTRMRFAELVGPQVLLVPEDSRRFAETLGAEPEDQDE